MRPLLPFLTLLLASLACGQTLEDAVRQIAKNIQPIGEAYHFSERSLAPEFAAETTRARTLLERSLRRTAPRDTPVVEAIVTATENINGPLLVVQINKSGEQFVETAAYVSQPAARQSRPSLVAKLLWRQEEPVLDIFLAGDQMLVLSPTKVLDLKRAGGGWETADSVVLDAQPSRDPRGRLAISSVSLTVFLPDLTCTGAWSPALELNCARNSGEFQIEGEQFRFTSGENTLETASGEKFYSLSRPGDLTLAASLDGNVYATRGQQTFAISGWGSDIVSLAAPCSANPAVLSSSSSTAGAVAESLTAYEIAGTNPRRLADPLPVQGVVTALWPASGGAISGGAISGGAFSGSAMAVVHETAAGSYAAYSVSLDCGN
ncbi:MAG TPA: hypothetical protein VIY49_00125 [Bryobacteraceae bacterium]